MSAVFGRVVVAVVCGTVELLYLRFGGGTAHGCLCDGG